MTHVTWHEGQSGDSWTFRRRRSRPVPGEARWHHGEGVVDAAPCYERFVAPSDFASLLPPVLLAVGGRRSAVGQALRFTYPRHGHFLITFVQICRPEATGAIPAPTGSPIRSVEWQAGSGIRSHCVAV
jgi:hypothetical protein